MKSDRNEIKLSFKEPKYHIDLANKVVVCILEGQPKVPDTIDWTMWNFTNNHMPAKYVTKAVARLTPGDEFDENIGMKVSLAKAENKAYEMLCSDIKKYLDGVSRAIMQGRDFLYKAANVMEHNIKYIDKF